MSNISTDKRKSLQELFNQLLEFRHLGLIIGLIYFIILLVVSLLYHKVGDYGVETDFFWGYVPEAKNFINGMMTTDAFRGPLYPMLLGIFSVFTGNYFLSGVLIGVLSATLLIIIIFDLIKRIFSPAIAFFVTIIVAANPVFVQYTYSAGTDMFFNSLAIATLYFFFKKKELNYKYLTLAAFIAGISYLTRYNGMFLLGFIFIIVFVNFWKIDWMKRWKASAVFLGVFILTFSPWGIYCFIQKGSFFYNENYKNIAYELFGRGKIPWDVFWFQQSSNYTSLFDVISRDLSLFISNVFVNVGNHFILDMEKLTGWFVGVFVILGFILLLVSNPVKRFKSRETGYYFSNLFFFGLLLLIFYNERFSLFLLPFYVTIAVQPFFGEQFTFVKKLPRTITYMIVIFLFSVTLAKSISFNHSKIDSGPNQLLEIQDFYNKNIPESEHGKKIAARKPHIAYYLDMEFFMIPIADTYDEFIEELRKNKVDYLYFSSFEAAMRRSLELLLDPEENHPGLKKEYSIEEPPAVLYRIVK